MKSMAHVDGTYWWHIHVVSLINRHYDEYRQEHTNSNILVT
jgi:hypothetical protein